MAPRPPGYSTVGDVYDTAVYNGVFEGASDSSSSDETESQGPAEW